MKNRVSTCSFLFLALMGMLFASCKKDLSEPPITNLPVGEVYTIDSILKMGSCTFKEDASVYGIVTADEVSGNLYKAAFIQDRATGAALELYMNSTSGVRNGDSIRVYLKGVEFAYYNGLPQLSGFEPNEHIVILANNKPIEPAEVTLADVLSGGYLGQLVRVKNVKFAAPELTPFAEPTTYGNRTIVDVNQTDYFATVRTSNYANFAKNTLPQGTGSMTCIASLYETSSSKTWQLIIRSISELSFDGYYSALPYFQAFTADFGSYTPVSVAGDQVWTIDYQTAKMTGKDGNNYYANEDWLISSPVAITGIDHAKVRVNYAAQYSNSNTEDVTLHVSTNYVAGMDPLDANVNWTQMNVTYPNTSGWDDFQTVETNLDEFLGQTVTVAVKFVSSQSQSRTMEIKFISVEEGVAAGGGGGGGGGQGGEIQNLPYAQSFETGFGTYVTKDVEGAQYWDIDYSSAKMSGYANGASNANEDWLISSPVSIVGVSHAKAVVNYAAKYQGASDNDITMQVSANYEYGADPATATWAELPVTYPNNSTGNSWTFTDQEASLDNFIGQTVTVAIKYTSTNQASRTIEIKNITIQEGEAGGTPTPPGPTPGDGEGSGTADDPYNVAAGISLQSSQPAAWVKGYIVGAVKNGQEHNTVTSNDDIDWAAPFGRATNVLIADDASCNDIAGCLIVKMPAGSALRTKVNLVDHPDNLAKELMVYGTLKNGFGQPGLDSPGTESDFVFEGGDTPTPPDPGTGIFSETFANGQGEFTIQDVELAGLSYVWNYMSNYHCMKANGYYQGAHATESWLVSPQIDLTSVTSATLKFDHAVAFASAEGSFFVMVSTDYAGDVTTATWTELNIGTWPTPNSSWVFEGASADMSSFVGQNVTIAFKYTSTMDVCPAWEVKNVVVE